MSARGRGMKRMDVVEGNECGISCQSTRSGVCLWMPMRLLSEFCHRSDYAMICGNPPMLLERGIACLCVPNQKNVQVVSPSRRFFGVDVGDS